MALIRDIWKQNQWLYILTGFFAGMLAFPALQAIRSDLDALLGSFVPEAIGIGFTVLFIDRLYRRREDEREQHQLKARLILLMGSEDIPTALNALRELKPEWLKDGSLVGKSFIKAGLERANFVSANLQQAKFDYANLQRARFTGANLEGAWLSIAKLQNADLSYANLGNARLLFANLQGADLRNANLQGVRLAEANLLGARLEETIFDPRTELPDKTKWKPDTDMTRFTNLEHPNFWRSDEPVSPAYREKDHHN